MSKEKQYYCQNCGNKNIAAANFCIHCGESLSKGGKQKNPPAKNTEPAGWLSGLNSYMVVGIGFVFSVIVVLLILNSNRETLYSKINSTVQSQQPSQNSALQEKIRELNLALLENPDNLQLNVQLANAYFDIGNFQNAIVHYEKAISIDDSDPNILIDLGVSYFNLNQTNTALTYIEKALDINPIHLQGLFNAGIVHYNLGDLDAAIRVWEKLVNTHSNSPEAQRASQFIEEVKQELNNS